VLVAATERARSEAEYRYDIDITTFDGRLCERWTDVCFRAAGRPLQVGDVPEALLDVVLERRVQDILNDTDIRVALGLDDRERREGSDAAFARLLDGRGPVVRGADGRPQVDGLLLSAAHAKGLSLAVAAPGAVSCDIELVAGRTEAEWQALLGPTRWQLAQLAAGAAGLTASAGGAVVWAAGECLVKAGMAPQSHLSVASSFPDGWLVLASAKHRIAATSLDGDGRRDIALAVLAERAVT
jgi:enediyne polyketide synthase